MRARNGYDYARADREAKEGRPAIIARYRSLMHAASTVAFASLAETYRKGASDLRARHGLTDAEVGP